MPEQIDFLFNDRLAHALEQLIKESDKKLTLISKYINLDRRIIEALQQKKDLPNFELNIIFGSYDKKDLSQDSFDFLKEFPNIDIRCNEDLETNFYQNETTCILTAMNLHDFSPPTKIEAGTRHSYIPDPHLGEDSTTIRQELQAAQRQSDVIANFQTIFNSSQLIYKTLPVLKKKSGIAGRLGKKQLDTYEIHSADFFWMLPQTDDLIPLPPLIKSKRISSNSTLTIVTEISYSSFAEMANPYEMNADDLLELAQQKGLIAGITDKRKPRG
jgi:hypothetical protein